MQQIQQLVQKLSSIALNGNAERQQKASQSQSAYCITVEQYRQGPKKGLGKRRETAIASSNGHTLLAMHRLVSYRSTLKFIDLLPKL